MRPWRIPGYGARPWSCFPSDIDRAADEASFAGVVSITGAGSASVVRGYGLAARAHELPFTGDTQFAMASGSKAFTAALVLSLVADGTWTLDLPARTWLGTDLPLIGGDVTLEHLLAHRSGIGDYVDEDADEQPPLQVPVQELDRTEAYLTALDGFPPKFPPGRRFSYCNSGYVVLALLAERATGREFAELLAERVWTPAGMIDTAFLRSDALPGRAAIGYLDDGRTNVFALPVVGSGDGGAYTTAADIARFWAALTAGRLVPPDWAGRMLAPSSVETGHPFRYGFGLWLDPELPLAMLEGCDHGASLRSVHDPATGRTLTVASNTTDGAFPLVRTLRPRVFD